jgi:starch synthase
VPSRLRILLIASEVAPFAKTGGLADVAGALPRALAALGHDVRILLPRYRGAEAHAGETRLVVPNIRVPLGDRVAEGALIEGRAPSGVPTKCSWSASTSTRRSCRTGRRTAAR